MGTGFPPGSGRFLIPHKILRRQKLRRASQDGIGKNPPRHQRKFALIVTVVPTSTESRTPHWTPAGRWTVFLLAATSIACLLFDFYRLCPMRLFTFVVFVPALCALFVIAVFDRQRGTRELWRAVTIGLVGGLTAAVAYDVFRLPFVFAYQWGISSFVPPLNLFKVFPRFGAMVLGQPIEQETYSVLTQIVGWTYHFSNGATFGVMYVAIVGKPTRRHWLWAVVMALALELGMLLTPYPQVFGIAVNPRFVLVTIAAHGIFGVGLGLTVRWLARWTASLQPGFPGAQSPS
jgi:hypothetical protein